MILAHHAATRARPPSRLASLRLFRGQVGRTYAVYVESGHEAALAPLNEFLRPQSDTCFFRIAAIVQATVTDHALRAESRAIDARWRRLLRIRLVGHEPHSIPVVPMISTLQSERHLIEYALSRSAFHDPAPKRACEVVRKGFALVDQAGVLAARAEAAILRAEALAETADGLRSLRDSLTPPFRHQ